MDRRLIEHFVNANLLSRQDMQRVILRASKDKTGVVTQLLDAGMVDDELLAEQIAQFYGYDLLDGSNFYVDHAALGLLTEKIATRTGTLAHGYNDSGQRVIVALYDPSRAKDVLEMLESATGQEPIIKVAPRTWLAKAIPYYYAQPKKSEAAPVRGRGGDFSSRPASGVLKRRGRVGDRSEHTGARLSALRRNRETRSRVDERDRHREVSFDDFDEMLDNSAQVLSPRASFAGRPLSGTNIRPMRASDDSSFGELSGGMPFWEQSGNNDTRWGWDESTSQHKAPEPVRPSKQSKSPRDEDDGFSLFEGSDAEPAGEMTLQELADLHKTKIDDLKDEAQRQREVIQALADLLVEARVISRRDLKRRLKDLRGR